MWWTQWMKAYKGVCNGVWMTYGIFCTMSYAFRVLCRGLFPLHLYMERPTQFDLRVPSPPAAHDGRLVCLQDPFAELTGREQRIFSFTTQRRFSESLDKVYVSLEQAGIIDRYLLKFPTTSTLYFVQIIKDVHSHPFPLSLSMNRVPRRTKPLYYVTTRMWSC